jgi:hypothetical protein
LDPPTFGASIGISLAMSTLGPGATGLEQRINPRHRRKTVSRRGQRRRLTFFRKDHFVHLDGDRVVERETRIV